MKNYLKIMVAVAGITLATFSTMDANATRTTTNVEEADGFASEGCRRTGDCGTTPGGVKLNGSWTIDSVSL
jgi:hypothetical protein